MVRITSLIIETIFMLLNIVATASGNSGTKGIFLTSSPASGKNVIAAGATLNSHVPGYVLKLDDTDLCKALTKYWHLFCILTFGFITIYSLSYICQYSAGFE
jgi:hypothetical protein